MYVYKILPTSTFAYVGIRAPYDGRAQARSALTKLGRSLTSSLFWGIDGSYRYAYIERYIHIYILYLCTIYIHER